MKVYCLCLENSEDLWNMQNEVFRANYIAQSAINMWRENVKAMGSNYTAAMGSGDMSTKV